MYIFSGITDHISEFCMGAYRVWGGQQNTRTRQLDSNRKVNIETSGGAHIFIYGFWFAGNFVIYVCQYSVAAARLAVFAWVVCVYWGRVEQMGGMADENAMLLICCLLAFFLDSVQERT